MPHPKPANSQSQEQQGSEKLNKEFEQWCKANEIEVAMCVYKTKDQMLGLLHIGAGVIESLGLSEFLRIKTEIQTKHWISPAPQIVVEQMASAEEAVERLKELTHRMENKKIEKDKIH